LKKLPTAYFLGGVFWKKMPQTFTNWVFMEEESPIEIDFDNRWKAGCKIAFLVWQLFGWWVLHETVVVGRGLSTH